jgi:hypothetical protein
MSNHDRAGEFGPIYLPALKRIRDCWLEFESLVKATAYDDVVAPTELQISLADVDLCDSISSGANWGCIRFSMSIAQTSTVDLIATRIHTHPRFTVIPHRTQRRRPPNRPVST